MTTITLSTGGTVRLAQRSGDTVIILDDPAAPEDLRNTEAGRIIMGGFQPAPFAAIAVRPETLRAIADLVEGVTS